MLTPGRVVYTCKNTLIRLFFFTFFEPALFNEQVHKYTEAVNECKAFCFQSLHKMTFYLLENDS